MPNWCLTTATITTDSEKTAKNVYDKLDEWLKEPDGKRVSDFGDGWLGNLAVNSGVVESYDALHDTDMAVRGEVDDVQLDGSSIYLMMSTAWGPMLEPLYHAIEKNFGFDGIGITYTAQEPNMQLFITNDGTIEGKYFVEIDEDADEAIKKAFGTDEYTEDTYDEDALADILRNAFDTDDNATIDELLAQADEYEGIYINLWEYENIKETF